MSSKKSARPSSSARPSPAALRSAESIMLERYMFMRQAGITFGGARDMYKVLGYDRVVTVKQYRDRYARGGIAGRIVDALPNATWRGTMQLQEDDDQKVSTAFEQAWDALEKRLKVTAVLRRVDVLSRLSTYAVLLIGAPGDLSQELPRGTSDKILYLSPFSGSGGPGLSPRAQTGATYVDATIESFDTDIQSVRFGLPLYYQLKRTDLQSSELQKKVHWSRVIHIAEGCLDDEVYGTPALERCWNLLDDLDKVTGGGAEAFWLRANQGLLVNVDKDAVLDEDAVKKLKEEVEEYKNSISRVMKTRGTEVKTLGSDTANFSNPADAVLTQIAGATSMPKRILTGSEMGELASSQDRDNWKDQINGRQTQYAGPYIVCRLVDRLIDYGYLPKPKQYEVIWPHIEALTEQEKAQGALSWANTNKAQGVTVFTPAEIRDRFYGFAPLTQAEEQPTLAPERVSAVAPVPAEDVPAGQKAVAIPGKPVAPPKPGNGKVPPQFVKGAFPKAAEEDLLATLEAAIVENDVETLDAILGTEHSEDRLETLGGPGSGWTAEGGHVPGPQGGVLQKGDAVSVVLPGRSEGRQGFILRTDKDGMHSVWTSMNRLTQQYIGKFSSADLATREVSGRERRNQKPSPASEAPSKENE